MVETRRGVVGRHEANLNSLPLRDRIKSADARLALSVLALAWAMWLTFMVRYPTQWAAKVDAIHSHLARYGMSSERMKRAEKGMVLKAIVGATVVLMLTSLVVTLRHPHALAAFYHAHYAGSH